MRGALVSSLLVAMLVAGCSSSSRTDTVHLGAVDHGRALFEDPKASPSASNTFSCATCHRAERPPARLDPGAPLGGVTGRKSFWGGQRVDLLAAVNDCRAFFMDAPRPWTIDDEDARAMYAFLAQLAPGAPPATSEPVPFTVVRPVDLAPGDPKRGAAAYDLACKSCHGTVHEGRGRLAAFIPVLPDEVARSHAALPPAEVRLVFVSKARAGAFRGGGSMPPFSREVLADEDLAGILAYFALY
jgi:thiosulfate dehydrogenase